MSVRVTADARHARRRVVLVSGAPGAGKSTMAGPLAAELRFALLSKDRIKETLHDGLGAPWPDLAWSRRLGGAAMELIWALAAQAPDVVLEANFRPGSDYERSRITALAAGDGDLVEVYCRCPVEVAMARYEQRASSSHPVHVVTALTAEFMAEFDRPVGLGALVVVDSSSPVDVAAVADEVRERLERRPG
jgi:predicted kinase